MKQRYVIIVAGGVGKRMGTERPKQFMPLAGKPVLMHSIEAFHRYDHTMKILVTLPGAYMDFWKTYCIQESFSIPHHVIEGGKERFFSVKNALSQIEGEGLVGVHDGARPLVDQKTIANSYALAAEREAAIPVIKLTESIRLIQETAISTPLDREKIRIVQTPQVFQTAILKKAYEQPFSPLFTDDATVVEQAGYTIALTEGSPTNIKLTTPKDLAIAQTLLSHGTDR
ncbi:MAG: 2-C-methyl-D-erythritol 4-phosphate cytidylyltransferase [Bacteroidetes bacterium]|nr:MAG: 2-C-methyl-D-erythritol 4-phosphate cytidylyltransferase [Bacteroidota bacterium]